MNIALLVKVRYAIPWYYHYREFVSQLRNEHIVKAILADYWLQILHGLSQLDKRPPSIAHYYYKDK